MSLTDLANESNGAAPDVRYRNPIENRWSEAAPKRLRKRYPLRGVPGAWEVWRHCLDQRRRPKPLDKLAGGLALDWALPDAVALTPAGELFRRLVDGPAAFGAADDGAARSTSLAETLTIWLGGGPGVDLALAYEALAWSRALRWSAGVLDESLWWRLFERLVELALDGDAQATGDPLVDQLLSAELALSLVYELPEVAAATELAARGYQIAQRGLRENSLGDGLPHARHLPTARALLACWTRVWTIVKKLDPAALEYGALEGEVEQHIGPAPAEPRSTKSDGNPTAKPRLKLAAPKSAAVPREFGDFLTTMLRLSRPDGSQMLSADGAAKWNRRLFAAASKLANRRAIDTAARIARPDRRGAGKKAARKTFLKPTAHAEPAGVALLRTDWRAGAPRLAVSFDSGAVKLELIAGKAILLSGLWSLDVRLAGETPEGAAAWEEICWVSDRDVDYLEIEAKLTGGLRVQRQMLLARNDRFLFLADGVLAPEAAAGPLEYRARIDVAADVHFEPAAESCEGRLTIGGSAAEGMTSPRSLVLPLGLPEWRGAARNGELRAAAGALELTQRSPRGRLFAPLFFDLDRRRSARQFTWRRLTVAESLAATQDDVAVGQRVEIGDQQWLFYRSLAARTPRTVLGQHFSSEFLAGRFHRNGEVDRLLEVESE